MWTCPECGRAFGKANQWHSCGVYTVAQHLEGKPDGVVALYHELERTMKAFGSVTVDPVKTRVNFQRKTTFAEVDVQQRGLRCHVGLARRYEHPLVDRIIPYGDLFMHRVKVSRPQDLLDVREILHEGWALVGERDAGGRA